MKRYPLLFTFHDKIEGDGFIADVETRGRALAVKEEDETWSIYGVQPGAIAGSGTTPLEAHANFRRTFSTVLFDFVSDAENFADFDRRVHRFFDEDDAASVAEWEAAVDAVRAGQVTAQELQITENGIRREPAESPRFVQVTCKHLPKQLRATANATDSLYLAAA
jgi:hypothetical protein